MTGRYDLTDMLDAIFKIKGRVREMRVATLSFNQHNVDQIQGWLTRAGAVERISVLCSLFFEDGNEVTYAALRDVIGKADNGSKLAASRNHCKVVTLDFESGEKISLEGSANLRTNSNREQFALINDPVLHDWHAQWIDEQVATHEESHERRSPEAG